MNCGSRVWRNRAVGIPGGIPLWRPILRIRAAVRERISCGILARRLIFQITPPSHRMQGKKTSRFSSVRRRSRRCRVVIKGLRPLDNSRKGFRAFVVQHSGRLSPPRARGDTSRRVIVTLAFGPSHRGSPDKRRICFRHRRNAPPLPAKPGDTIESEGPKHRRPSGAIRRREGRFPHRAMRSGATIREPVCSPSHSPVSAFLINPHSHASPFYDILCA